MKTAHDYARYLMSLIHFSDTNVRAQTRDCAEAAFVQVMADARREALEQCIEVFVDFKTTPVDESGYMQTTQGEVDRIAAKLRALLEPAADSAKFCAELEGDAGGVLAVPRRKP